MRQSIMKISSMFEGVTCYGEKSRVEVLEDKQFHRGGRSLTEMSDYIPHLTTS